MLLWDAAVGWGSRARRVRCSRLPLVSGGTAVPDQNASFRQAGLRRWDPSLATATNPVQLRSLTTRPSGASSADAPAEPLSESFEAGSLRYDAGGEISPQSHQELAGERHGADLAHPAAGGTDALVEPARQPALGLVAQP